MNTNNHRVWMIIGTSQGFGRELVRAALQRGDSVIATSRMIQRRLPVPFRPCGFQKLTPT
jgi:NAD(P)-dependent dehydrogenase (short-subunit alcohol dehydrogenase family)